jgi:hypothetical protein
MRVRFFQTIELVNALEQVSTSLEFSSKRSK